MEILKFIKNAWKFRKELTKWKAGDYRCHFSLLRKGMELELAEIKQKDTEWSKNPSVAAMTAFNTSIDQIVKDNFLEEAIKIVKKDKDFKWPCSKPQFLLDLDTKELEEITKVQRAMFNSVLNIAYNTATDPMNGMLYWVVF